MKKRIRLKKRNPKHIVSGMTLATIMKLIRSPNISKEKWEKIGSVIEWEENAI